MLLLALALACKPEPEDSTPPVDTDPGVGTLALSFAIEPDYIPILAGDGQEPVGTFYGSFWRGDEVTGAGPDEGAVDLGSIEVALVDLTPDGGPSAVLFTSEELPAIEVVVLGFLDTDSNGGETHDPDDGDPVTLPADNDFDVIEGETTAVTVFFGLLNP